MTAEVAIMNKLGVALAADSAVTISSRGATGDDRKIYNSANKLFTLSKFNPVGLMIFDSAEFMGVPWDVLIKMYRNHLGDTEFDTTQEYADNLFSYLQNNWPDPKSDEIYVKNVAVQVAHEVCDHSDKKVRGLFDKDESVTDKEVAEKITESLDEAIALQREHLDNSDRDNSDVTLLSKKFSQTYIDIAKGVFGNRPLTKNHKEKFKKLASLVILVHPGIRRTGLVVAGYGGKEIYPSVLEFEVTKLFSGKIESCPKSRNVIALDSPAVIVPFA